MVADLSNLSLSNIPPCIATTAIVSLTPSIREVGAEAEVAWIDETGPIVGALWTAMMNNYNRERSIGLMACYNYTFTYFFFSETHVILLTPCATSQLQCKSGRAVSNQPFC